MTKQSPKAYLNYIMLDKNFNYLNSGFERLAESAADDGTGNAGHQKLSFEEIAIAEDGYLMVFLSNESQQQVEVFWDDFRVEHHYHAVLQADDYYPFGLSFNSYKRSYSKANNYKYNGIENVPDLGLNVNMYMFRTYDPALGRWWQVDPLYKHFESPYVTVTNNPIRYVDFLGLDTLRTDSKEFNWKDVKDDDVVIGPEVMDEVVGSTASAPRKKKKEKRGGVHWTGLNGQGAAEEGNPSHESDLPYFMGGYSNKGLLNVFSSFLAGWNLAGNIYDFFTEPENKSYEEEENDIKPKDPSISDLKEIKASLYQFQDGYDFSFEWDGAKYYPIIDKPDSLTLLIYWNKGKEVKKDTLRIK